MRKEWILLVFFCGLNEVRNIIPSIKYAKEAGMIPQATLCITYSPVHTVDYYSYIADQLIEGGGTRNLFERYGRYRPS